MAARYVNPTNVVAQGQDFYTGLPAQDQQQAGSGGALATGSYSGHGGGGGANVMGRGSGGSAGVSADRTGSDSSKSWNYKPSLNIAIDVRDRRLDGDKVKPEGPEGDDGPTKVTPVDDPHPKQPQQRRDPYGPTSVATPNPHSGGPVTRNPHGREGPAYGPPKPQPFGPDTVPGGPGFGISSTADLRKHRQRQESARKGAATKAAKRAANQEEFGDPVEFDATIGDVTTATGEVRPFQPGWDKVKSVGGGVSGPYPMPGASHVSPAASRQQGR